MVLNTFSALCGSLGRFRHSVLLRLLATVLLFSCVVTLLADRAFNSTRLPSAGSHLSRAGCRISTGAIETVSARVCGGLTGSSFNSNWRACFVSPTFAPPRYASPARSPRRWCDRRQAHERRGRVARIFRFLITSTVRNGRSAPYTLKRRSPISIARLAQTALVILVSQAANTFLVALFIIYIFLAARHAALAAIARLSAVTIFARRPGRSACNVASPAGPTNSIA